MKLPFESLIEIQKKSDVPLYRQIANGISMGIERGIILPGEKLPGTRELSLLLKVHRNTVIAAFQDLSDHGWVHITPPVGSFVNTNIPKISAKKLPTDFDYPQKTGFKIEQNVVLQIPKSNIRNLQYLEID